MANTIDVVIDGYEDVIHRIDSMHKNSAKVINRTMGDFRSRGPGWVSQEVVKEYNIKKKDVNAAKKGVKNVGNVKVSGVTLDNLEIHYQSRLLTPTHFSMKPASRPANGKAYNVTAQIKKMGARKALSHKAFLSQSGGEGTTHIPFQRKGQSRYPIEPIKTVSVPQMIDNSHVNEDIYKRINEELGKRLEHNLNRILSKGK